MNRLLAALSTAAVLLSGSGCASDPANCCDRYGPTDDNGIYCLAHKDAVLRFVKEPPDPEQRRARLEWFRLTLKTLEPLEDSDEVDATLSRLEKERPDFWRAYSAQHFWAGRDTNLPLKLRGELMKCGFRHAVHQLGRELGANP